MFIGNAHSNADSNTIGDTDANTNSYGDTGANRNTYCDANSDATTTNTYIYANCNNHPNSNCNCNNNTYGNTYKPTREYMLSANDGEPCFCSKHAVEFYGSGQRDRCDVKDNFKRRSCSQLQRI